MQTVTCNVECSYVHEYFQYMITPYTDFDQGGEGKYSEFQVTGTGMIEGFFFLGRGGGAGGGRGEWGRLEISMAVFFGRENLASIFLWVRGLIQVGTFGHWCLKCC